MARRKTMWRDTQSGKSAYVTARADAQRRANELGFDHGIEANELFKHWHVFMLPMRGNRHGHELMCEVVSPENLDCCKPGHGPCVGGTPYPKEW